MPRIQRLLSQRATIAPQPDPEAFGAAEGRALTQVGGAVRGIASTATGVGQALADLSDGYQQQLSLSRSTEADDSLRRFSEDLEQDTDFQGRERRFSERAAELREELGRDIKPGPRKFEFEQALTRASNRHAITVRSTALRDEMSSAELMANDTARRLATVAATSSSPFDQATARLDGQGVYEAFGERFGVDPAQTEKAIRDFNLEVDDAIFAERMRTDPVDAYRRLQTPGEGLAKYRTEVERQTMLTRSIDEVEYRLRKADYQERSEITIKEGRRKSASRNAQNAFVAAGQTPEGLSIETINELGDSLTANEKKGWLEWQMNTGGKIQRTELNVNVYENLSDRAKAGEDVTSLVYEAERDGDLDPGSRNAIIRSVVELGQGKNPRFEIADEFMATSLKVGEFIKNPAVRARNGRAKLLWDLWKIENPNATMEEAIAEAQFQSDRALLFEADSITAFQLPPQFAVSKADRSLDVKATERELTKRLVSGEMTQEEFDREVDLAERFEEAQKSQALREQLKARKAEANK